MIIRYLDNISLTISLVNMCYKTIQKYIGLLGKHSPNIYNNE